MWSLYKRTTNPNSINPFDSNGEKLPPLKFSNNKTQADVVKEILDTIEKGNKLIFIKGVCGTGKSAIALNLARHFKKTSIIVPIKSLQEQYEKDYTKNKFILKQNKKPLDIAIIKGRNNFRCPFNGERADDPELPCTIEIREKNTDQLLNYIEQNPETNREDFQNVSDIKRMNIAPACPYWGPVMPAEIEPKSIKDFKRKKFPAICGKEFAYFQRKQGCEYCDQYCHYTDADVLIFNSMKYMIETEMGRKPKTDLDIIDECDEFLDKFADEKKLNLKRLHSALMNLTPSDQEKRTALKEIIHEINTIMIDKNADIEVEKLDKTYFKKI